MVTRIIENHGGEIRVDSTLNEGTVFTIYLPLAVEHMPMAAGDTLLADAGAEGANQERNLGAVARHR
jgi:hypothetical protein